MLLSAKSVDPPPTLQVEFLTVTCIPNWAQAAVVWGQALADPWAVSALVVMYLDRRDS